MAWWPYPRYWRYPYTPLNPEEELKQLEDYRRQLEEEIKSVREELERVEKEIKEMRERAEEWKKQQPTQPTVQPPYPPAYPTTPQTFTPPYSYGYGYGYGWGRGRGMGGGFGRGMGPGMMPGPGAAPQQPPIPPPQPGVRRIVASVDENNGLNSRISLRFGRCPFLAFVDLADGEVKAVNIIPNQAVSMPMGAGIAVAQMIVGSGATEVVGSSFGPNVSMAFQQAGLQVHVVEPGITLGEALKKLGLIR